MNQPDRFSSGRMPRWVLICVVSLGGVLLVAMGGVAAETEPADCSGVGFEQDTDEYYEVENLSQLQCIEEHGLEKDYVLVNDIDASETEEWNEDDGFEPIGDGDVSEFVEGDAFNGTFDGNDRTIADLTIDRGGEDFVGLFEVIGSEGTVSNLTLESVTVTGDDDVGSLSGQNYGTVSDVSMSTDVTGSGTTGGVIGWNDGGTITGATVEGAVFSEQDGVNTHVGGIVGDHQRGASIDSSSFTNGTVDGEDEKIGGIAGQLTSTFDDTSSITNSSAHGTIGNEDADSVGGLVGEGRGDFFDSYSTATVRGNDTVGGVIGNAHNSDIERTYAVGEVDGDGDAVGGLVGVGASGIGSDFNIENSYWDIETTGVNESFDSEEDGLTTSEGGLTTDEMTGVNATEHMNGFGFPDGDGHWHAVEDDYPVLSYEDTDPVYGVEITGTNSAIDEGETLEVDATVTNVGSDGGEQSIELLDFDDGEVDTEEVTLESGESTALTLEWETAEDEGGLDDVTVASENDTDTRAVSVGEGEVIPQCQTIDTSGAYDLTDDIEASGECLGIEADDVSIDGNDHTISGSGTGMVVDKQSNVTITNVTLSGLDVGIEMTDIENATVEHNTVEESHENGLVFDDVQDSTIANNTVTEGATSGIHLADVTGTAVKNNTLRENDESGMYVVDSEELVVSGNEVVDNGDDEKEPSDDVEDAGIYFSGTSDSYLEANNLTANAQAALFLEEASTDNDLVKNSINSSPIGDGKHWNAVRIDDSSGNTISDSVISTGEVDRHSDRPEYFIYVDSAETVVKDNEIDGHARAGIDIRGESNTVDNNTIAGSFFRSDAQNGHAIRVFGGDDDSLVTNNSLTNAEILHPERAGIAIIEDQAVEIQNNTGTQSGPDLKLTNEEQSVENQQITTPAGDTTVTFTGAELRLDGVDESPADHDTLESTGYYFEVDNTSDEFTFENFELDYNETRLTTGDTIDPETLSLWRLDSGEWEEIDDSSVDTDEEVVTGNVTEDGTIGVFGEEPVLTDLAVDDVTIEQGEPLEVDLEDAEDSIGDPYDDESEVMFESDIFDADLLDEPLMKNVTFEDGGASDVELLDANKTADLSAASPEVYIEGQDAADSFHLTVEAVLAEFDVADDVGIDQGEPLAVDLENATDKAGDPYIDTVDLTGDEIDGQELSAEEVEFDEGEATGVELLEAETTEEISAEAYENVTLEAAETDATAQFDATLEIVLGDFTVEDEEIEQGESLTMTVSDAVDLAGDDFYGEEQIKISTGDLEGNDTDVEKIVDFAGTDEVELELFEADETAALGAQETSIDLEWADDTDVGATSEVDLTAVLNEFAVEPTNETIEQGDALTLEITDAEDVAGDTFTGTVDLTVDEIGGEDATTTDVGFTDGSATGVELFDGETPTLAADSYDDLEVTAQEADSEFDVTVAPVLTTLDVEDATITRGDPLSVTITGAFDLAGDPFEEERETTVGMDALEGIDDETETVVFDGEDTVELTEILDAETTLDIDADTYTLDMAAESAAEEFELSVEDLFADGDGSADDPYIIEDWEHLDNARFALDANVTLANDLDADTPGYSEVASEDANDGNGFEPIGNFENAFEGLFDGDGATISDLYINRTEESGTEESDLVGLFGQTDGTAIIEDVRLENATVRGTSNVGGLVGAADGTIANVSVAVDVEGDAGAEPGGPFEIGGLVGTNSGQVENATVEGSVTVEGGSEVGGLAGYSGELGGGIGDITDSHATVTVDAEDSTNVGGLLGNAGPGGTVSTSSATGTVAGEENVGGLVGMSQSDIERSFATGEVSGTQNVGGLLGSNNNGIVRNATASSPVDGDENVGGLVGENSGDLSHAFATGNVDGDTDVGGLVGFKDDGSVEDSYWDLTATTQDGSASGEPLTTDEMQGASANYTMDALEFGHAFVALESAYPELVSNRETATAPAGIDTADSSVEATSPHEPDGEDAATVTVWVTDTAGDPVTGLEGSDFDVERGSAEFDAESAELEGEPGVYEFTLINEKSETSEVAVTVDGQELESQAVIDFEEPAFFEVDIGETNAPVLEGESLEVTATVTNTGDQKDTQTVNLTTDSASTELDETNVTLEGGEHNDSVTLTWNTEDGDAGAYDVIASSVNDTDTTSVTVETPPEADLTALDIAGHGDEATILEGDAENVTTTVENSGEREGSFELSLETGDGVVKATEETQTLEGGAEETVKFENVTDGLDPDEYVVVVSTDAQSLSGNLSVEAPANPVLSSLDIAGDGSEAAITQRDDVDVGVSVTNVGDRDGVFDVDLEIGDEVTAIEDGVSVDAGETVPLAFEEVTGDLGGGTYAVTVSSDDVEVHGDLMVETPAQADLTDLDIAEEGAEATTLEGDEEPITTTVENVGDREGSFEVALEIGDDVVEETMETGTVAGGGEETVRFENVTDDLGAGEYEITVEAEGGTLTGTLQVEAPGVFEMAIEETTTPVVEGDPLEVSANVSNTGDVETTQTVNLTTDSTSTELDETDVTLAGGESNDSVILTWETEHGDGGEHAATVSSANDTDTVPVVVERPASFSMSELEPGDVVAETGDSIDVSATVTNTGDVSDDQQIDLRIDGENVASESVALDGSEATTVEFTDVSTDELDPGAHEYGVFIEGESATGTLTLEEPAFFEMSIEETNAPVVEGDSLEVSASVTNTGDVTATQTVNLTTDSTSTELDGTDVTLEGGESDESVTLAWETEEGDADGYDVIASSANDTDTASITIETPPEAEVTELDIAEDGAEATILEGDDETVTTTVENIGDREGSFDVTLEIEHVEESVSTSETEDVSVDAGETASLSFESVTSDLEAGTYTVTVSTDDDGISGDLTVEKSPEFTMIYVDPAYGMLEPGEEEHVLVTVANEGDSAGDAAVVLDFEGEESTETLELDAGSAADVEFSPIAPEEEGEYEYTISVGDEETTETMVVEPIEPLNPEWNIDDFAFSPDAVEPGADVDVAAIVENTGGDGVHDDDIRVHASFYIGDEEEEVEALDVDGGDSETAEATLTAPEEDGEYEIGVSLSTDQGIHDEQADELVVGDSGADETDDGDESDDEMPGFGLLTALLALAFLGVGLSRRRYRATNCVRNTEHECDADGELICEGVIGQ
ncbi:right-handed parallel beta-helix repeat-containing protein [Halobacteria archaeon AArc-dxtr1]|nr:right-handed parallel beta-helix repeat-containing protein [Halobacteria archaeon AArc-dxtr1]